MAPAHPTVVAELMRLAALASCLRHLGKKDKPFAVIVAQAGAADAGARRTVLAQLEEAGPPAEVDAALQPLREAAGADGSDESDLGAAAIAVALVRAQDAVRLCAWDEAARDALAARFGADGRVTVAAGDGYAALPALLPPPERRGLVLLDPPFEHVDEMFFLAQAAKDAIERWPTGTFLFARPLTDLWAAERFDVALAEWLLTEREAPAEKILRADLWAGEGGEEASLDGAGLIIVNPPYGLEEALLALLPWLAEIPGESAGWRLDGALTETSLTVDEF